MFDVTDFFNYVSIPKNYMNEWDFMQYKQSPAMNCITKLEVTFLSLLAKIMSKFEEE